MNKNNIMTDKNEFLVPDWLFGSAKDVEKATRVRARAWATAWRKTRIFPSVIWVAPKPHAPLLYATSDNQPEQPRARLFANANFVPQIMEACGYLDTETLVIDYEAHIGCTVWGSFEGLLFQRTPNSLEVTRLRLERIIPHLPKLSSIVMVDYDNVQRTAVEVVDSQIFSTLNNWDVDHNEPLDVRINMALTAIEKSNPDSILERIVTSMLSYVSDAPRLLNRNKLTAVRIRGYLARLNPDEYDELTGCTRKSLLTELYAIDREIT